MHLVKWHTVAPFDRVGHYNLTIPQKEFSPMSVLHHESILEQCLEEAVEQFCSNNELTPEMFAEIENHEGVQLALEKSTMRLFEDRLQ